MEQITEDYCNFDTAKLLKEKGFDEPTERFYNEDRITCCGASSYNWNEDEGDYSRPTLWLAMKWLREVHHCVICITPLTFYCGELVSKWGYCIWADYNTEVDEESSPRLESYEEAAESAIKYCLEKLI